MAKSKNTKRKYVIQKHDATNLHYDLRLEDEGVLKSWAVPKKPSKDPNTKRLAVQVDDHKLDYADFEGEIPEGQYGSGTVEIWDSGTYELLEKSKNKYIIDIHGKKLKGTYNLIRTKFKGKKKNWLFFKKKEKDD
ncbi:MAG: DNA polymerase ligase N-terminal domain-containing protein [Candidatus Undinarchaeales archaeon]